MTKRTLLLILLCCASALGQQQPNPWNCNNPKNEHLICFVPVATRSLGAVNSPAPTFNSAFATQLSQLPVLSSGSGVVLVLDRKIGVYVASDNLGPILTDRAQTIGRHKLLLAFGFQYFNFNAIDGTSLNAAPFVFTAPSGAGGTQYTVEGANISLKLDQYVGIATFGLTAKTDVSVIIPFGDVSIASDSLVTLYSVATDGSKQSCVVFDNNTGKCTPFSTPHLGGSANGIADVLVNVKQLLWSGEKTYFSAGFLVRFPTGDALNYLGSGAYGFNPYAIFSYQARVSPHIRVGYQFNTATVLLPNFNPTTGAFTGNSNLPGGLQYDFGADYVLFKKVPTTVAGDFLGNYVVNSPVLLLKPFGSQTLTQAWGINPPALFPGTASYGVGQFSIGAKVKPWKNLIFYGNVLFQINNAGLRSNPVPLAGVSYTFF